MTAIAAYLVVMEQHAHPDQVEATIAATRQLRGVVGIRTVYDDAGREIRDIREDREQVRAHTIAQALRDGVVAGL